MSNGTDKTMRLIDGKLHRDLIKYLSNGKWSEVNALIVALHTAKVVQQQSEGEMTNG